MKMHLLYTIPMFIVYDCVQNICDKHVIIYIVMNYSFLDVKYTSIMKVSRMMRSAFSQN